MTRAEETIQNLTRFGAGALDELLFGLPEYALKNLGKRKEVEGFIEKAPRAYKAGETAGTIGSIFLPLGLAGKGVKALTGASKAAKLLPEATAVTKKGVDWAKLLKFAGRGSAAGAAESGIRNITSESETPWLEDVSRGGFYGGVGGAIGGTLAEALPRVARLAKKQTEKAVLGTTDARTRDLLKTVQKMSPHGAGPGYQTTRVDDIREGIADLVKKEKLWKPEAVEKAYEKNKAVWKTLDDTFEKVAGNKPASVFLQGALDESDLARLSERFGKDTVDKATETIMQQVGNKTGLPNTREALDNVMKFARTAPVNKMEDQNFANALHEIAGSLRSNLDDAVIGIAEAQGAKIPPNFRQEWGLLQPIFKGEVRSEITPSKFGLGSPTWEKAVAGSIIGGVGTGAMTPGDIEDRLKMGVGGAILGGLGTKAIGAGLTRAVGKADTLAGKLRSIAPAIAEAPGLGAIAGGRAAADVVNARAQEAVKPKTEEQAKAVEAGAEAAKAEATGRPEAYLKLINDRMAEFWGMSGAEQMFPGQFEVFKAMVAQYTDNFDPIKTAAVIYPDKDKREKFLKAYQISKRITSSFGEAEQAPRGIDVIPGLFDDEELKAKRLAAEADILGILSKAIESTGAPNPDKTAKQLYGQIMGSKGTPAEKQALLSRTLAQFGIDFETLKGAGLA